MSEPSSQNDPPPLPPVDPAVKDRCKCGHIRFRHQGGDETDGHCRAKCGCAAFRPVTVEDVPLPEPDCPEQPPQPERRPPYAVAYSVGGHLYEALLPGDASASAVDGALVIQHGEIPVLGVVQIRPVRAEASDD